MSYLGKIQSVWRYPVKNMRGEEVTQIYAGFSGLMGDRTYGIIAEDGHPGFPWHTGRDHEEFILYEPRFKNSDSIRVPENLDANEGFPPGVNPIYPEMSEFAVEVKTPEGEVHNIMDASFLSHLQTKTGRKLRVHATSRGQFDSRPLSLISLSAIKALEEETGQAVDKRRFRANFYVDWANNDDPYFEFSLIGKRLKIGERLLIEIVERDPRCKIITLDPDTAEENPKLLQHVTRKHGGDAGVFAVVVRDGRISTGDTISLA
jgi:hypothetical protein